MSETPAFQYDLKGVVPSKKNSRIVCRASGRNFPSDSYSSWHEIACCVIPRTINMIRHPVCVKLDFRMKDFRVRDLSNMAESVMDTLVDCCIIEDDKWVICRKVVLTGTIDKTNPGVRISIWNL